VAIGLYLVRDKVWFSLNTQTYSPNPGCGQDNSMCVSNKLVLMHSGSRVIDQLLMTTAILESGMILML